MQLPLYATKEWWENRDKAIKEECNGCGSDLDLSGKLVPNTLYGLDISKKCCCPHDHGYIHGVTWLDKIFTDVMFLYNMTAVVLNAGMNSKWYSKDKLLVIPRLLRATKYFIAVVEAGDRSFKDGKETVSNEKIITFKGEFR
ncbi:hypothetical protein [Halarcobacter sp.]|uniref:hypothetical protein n=1 Tax=Halarcobacter sp. TaxID=2321133 RepID=UPI0029F47E5B|nr:hypothetical protein [Halarcobacter sp.]